MWQQVVTSYSEQKFSKSVQSPKLSGDLVDHLTYLFINNFNNHHYDLSTARMTTTPTNSTTTTSTCELVHDVITTIYTLQWRVRVTASLKKTKRRKQIVFLCPFCMFFSFLFLIPLTIVVYRQHQHQYEHQEMLPHHHCCLPHQASPASEIATSDQDLFLWACQRMSRRCLFGKYYIIFCFFFIFIFY